MLYLYTPSGIPKEYRLVQDAALEFEVIVSQYLGLLESDKVVHSLLKEIEGSTLESKTLVTRFGDCSIFDCSAGAKTAILAYLYRNEKKLINAVECGANVFNILSNLQCDTHMYVSSCNPISKADNIVTFNGKQLKLWEVSREVSHELFI